MAMANDPPAGALAHFVSASTGGPLGTSTNGRHSLSVSLSVSFGSGSTCSCAGSFGLVRYAS